MVCRLQCKHLPIEPIMQVLHDAYPGWVCYCLGEHSRPLDAALQDAPFGLKRAKMASLIARGLVDGCACGCRGDFVLTKQGLEWFREHHGAAKEHKQNGYGT
jgi:hypothetical protein